MAIRLGEHRPFPLLLFDVIEITVYLIAAWLQKSDLLPCTPKPNQRYQLAKGRPAAAARPRPSRRITYA